MASPAVSQGSRKSGSSGHHQQCRRAPQPAEHCGPVKRDAGRHVEWSKPAKWARAIARRLILLDVREKLSDAGGIGNDESRRLSDLQTYFQLPNAAQWETNHQL